MDFLAQAAPGGFLDSMTQNMIATGNGFEARSFQMALGLFAVLSLAGGSLYLARYQSSFGTLHGVQTGLFSMVKNIAIALTIMLGVGAALPNLIGIAMQLSGDITGVVIQGPSEVFALGFQIAMNLTKQPITAFTNALTGAEVNTGVLGAVPGVNASANALALAQNGGHMLTAGLSTLGALIIALLVILCFALITVEYVVAVANVVIVLAVGAVQMGWSAAPGTADMAGSFYASISGAIFRFITIVVIVAFIGATVAQWGVFLATNDISKLFSDWLQIASGSIVCAVLALKLPAMAQHAFSGQPAIAGGHAIQVAQNVASQAASGASVGIRAIAGGRK